MISKSMVCDLIQIFKSSVLAVLPENLIRNSLKYNPKNEYLTIVSDNYNLKFKNVYVVGTGKAVQNMAKQVENILASKIKLGIISIPVGSLKSENITKNIHYFEGAKDNLPDAKAESTAKKVRDLVTKLKDNDLLIVLISGGGSALLPLPKEPITLQEKTALIRKLANSGADIKELNTVRKRLSDLKGGQLAMKAQPAQVISLILSDIVGDPLDLIASGPTTENKDHPSKAIDIIKKYNLLSDIPESIKKILNKTENPQSFREDNIRNHIIGSNKLSISAALNEANNLNYIPIDISNVVTGNVKSIAKEYVKLTGIFCNLIEKNLDISNFKLEILSLNIPGIYTFIENFQNTGNIKNKDVCLILGGEITVEVMGNGKGGRNQQLALEFSNLIYDMKNDLKNFDIYFLSAGTDGIDGPTDAAGAIGYVDLKSDAQEENLDIQNYLNNNDSYNFYKEFQNGKLHVITGHTNTNVMDIHLIIIKRK